MAGLLVATVQFENCSGDKEKNIAKIRHLTAQAANAGANVVTFHECSITGYTFARHLSHEQLRDLAEPVPSGTSTIELIQIAKEHSVALLAGLFEIDENKKVYNTYICVTADGLLAKFRKINPFINPHLSAGNEYVVFDYLGWKFGILICYDNNVIENVRATALLGAEIIVMPHVTMCTPSTRPVAGFVDPELWKRRIVDPTSVRAEFDGLKGRSWLMKWLPARAYDNGVYVVFSNPIGMDDDQLKNGCSMILDPFGDILSECRELGDCFCVATCVKQKLTDAGGFRYRKARRPGMYREILGAEHVSELNIAWGPKGGNKGASKAVGS